jgi:hypothetical protein
LNRRRHRGDCSILILLVLALVVGGWFYLQRRDHERKTSPEFLEELRKVTIALSEMKETRPDGKVQVYVSLKNGSGRTLDGKIAVFSREINGVTLDRAILTLMPLAPGESTTLVAWLRKSSIRPDFQYELDVNFK